MEELDLFGFELGLLTAEQVPFVAGRRGESVEHLAEHGSDLCCFVLGDGDVLVSGFDALRDAVDRSRRGGSIATRWQSLRLNRRPVQVK